jgi:hypothetical protein
MTCDFEQSSICNYVQDQSDTPNFDWTWKSGGTGSASTGPPSDHTTGTRTGHYIYIETSAPRQPNDTARISTPNYTPQVNNIYT